MIGFRVIFFLFFFTCLPMVQAQVDEALASDIQFEAQIPRIVVSDPQDNFVTYAKSIVLKGHVANSQEFFINSRVVSLDASGNFRESFDLPDEGKYVFNLYALGAQNLNSTEILKVFRVLESDMSSTKVVKSPIEANSMKDRLKRRISLDLSGVDIKDVLQILSQKGEMNIISDQSLSGPVFLSLNDVTLQNAIDLVLNTKGLSYKMVGNTILVGSSQQLDVTTRLETQVVRLDNMKAKVAEGILARYMGRSETIQSLEAENMLVIHASPEKMDSVLDIVKRMDAQKVPQIILEAQILEVSKSSLDNMGVAWSSTYGLALSGVYTNGVTAVNGGLTLDTIINLLESEGKARVLAKPRIKAIDREKAEIFIGDKLPYITLATDPSGRVQESVQFVDSGIRLSVIPDINTHTQEIKIKIAPEVSYVNGFKGQNNDIPIVRTRKVNTTVFVKDGATVLIGGLFNSSDSDTESRVPLFGKIPLLGKIFSSNKLSLDQTELVIAITPKIIDREFQEIIPQPSF